MEWCREMKEQKLEEVCSKYITQLTESIEAQRKYKKNPPIIMLSGGVDSMILGAIAKTVYGEVISLTVAGKNTPDIQVARKTAYHLGIENIIIQVSYNEIMKGLESAKGRNIKNVFSLLFYLMFQSAFKKYPVKHFDLLQGDGADSLLGSTSSFIYMKCAEIAEKENITKDEARTICKQKFFQDSMRLKRGTADLFKSIANEESANAVQPFRDPKVFWVNDLPYSLSRPDKKLLHREVIKKLGYNPKNVKRVTMQQGTGFYEVMKQNLINQTNCKNANQAVQLILNGV